MTYAGQFYSQRSAWQRVAALVLLTLFMFMPPVFHWHDGDRDSLTLSANMRGLRLFALALQAMALGSSIVAYQSVAFYWKGRPHYQRHLAQLQSTGRTRAPGF